MRASVIIPACIIDDEVYHHALRMKASLGDTNGVEIIVVDNGSMCSVIWPATPGARIVRFPQALGCARATNIGLALATTDYLVVASVDVIFHDPNWLTTLINEYRRAGPGILSPGHDGRQGVWEESWYAVWMTDRLTHRIVGYHDERLGNLLADQDYSIRMAKAGFKVQRTGAVQVSHPDERSTVRKQIWDTSAEHELMMERYGCIHFRDWIANGRRT